MLTVDREPVGKEHLISGERFLGKRFLGVKRGEVGPGLSLGMSSKHMSRVLRVGRGRDRGVSLEQGVHL